MFSMCSATMKLKNFFSHLLSKKEKRKEPALSRLFFWFNATRVGCNQQNQQICCSITQFQSNATRVGCNQWQSFQTTDSPNFNLTQPVWVATASLHKRNNKLSCILYNVCLFFDQTIWSDTTYCNGIISFLYNTRCEATSKTMFTYHPHL